MTGTHFNYYHVCKRKLWLFANGIQMEHTSDMVYDGKLIHEQSYPQRSERYEEMEIDGIKIDYYDPRNKVIHEIKRSDKVEKAHEWQVKYYIRVLERNGISDPILPWLKGLAKHVWLTGTLRTQASLVQVRRLQDAGVRVLLLKGAALQARCPEIVDTRPMGDFDILVPPLQLRLYDRIAPMWAKLEEKVTLPFGQSLFAVARREA